MTEAERKKHMKTAMTFKKSGEAYVHAEYRDGENPLIVAGDGIALIRIIERMMTRLAVLTEQDFSDVVEVVELMHEEIPEDLS